MSSEYFEKLSELNNSEIPFAVATVIKISGSVSAKTGAKSIINAKKVTIINNETKIDKVVTIPNLVKGSNEPKVKLKNPIAVVKEVKKTGLPIKIN